MHCPREGPTRHVELEVDDLAEFIFIRNKTNTKIELEIQNGIKNNKDLFCFIIDLLCKGLIYLFGVDNKVEIDDLSLDDFALVSARMQAVGIKIHMDVVPNIDHLPPKVTTNADFLPDNLVVREYQFQITSAFNIYKLSFELTR